MRRTRTRQGMHGDAGGGFAEILFGRPARPNKPADAGGPDLAPAALAVESEEEDMPVGALFAGSWPLGTPLPEPEDSDPMDFRPAERDADRPGLGRLLVLIILAALLIAIIMAHLTGLAPWR